MANLRIIYQNVADLSTTVITPSTSASSSTGGTNLTKDTKSLVWRSMSSASSASIKANILVTFPTSSNTLVGGVILPFTNLSPNATIRIRTFSGSVRPQLGGTIDVPVIYTSGTTLVSDTGNILACPYLGLGTWDWGAIPTGANSYSYGGGTYARVWLPETVACTSLVIEIIDNRSSYTSPAMYVEVSRLVIGTYWSPKFNTNYGLSTTIKDLSTHSRTESGDLLTNRGVRFNSMNFDLNWLVASDRSEITKIVKGNGMPKPLLISLFPNNSTDWEKEQAHQIYGKLSDLAAVAHPIVDMYSTSISIEEI